MQIIYQLDILIHKITPGIKMLILSFLYFFNFAIYQINIAEY